MDLSLSMETPVLTGKVILITGGTDGLGKESVCQLSLRSPAHIYMAGRNKSKAAKVLEELKERHPDHAPVTFLEMDQSCLASVKAAVSKFLSENNRLDILMCNAGTSGQPALTKEGYELGFGVNHLSHALMIQLLLPVMQQTAQSPESDVRVILLSSVAEKMAPKHYTFDKMKTPLERLGTMTRYGQTKLANIHYAAILAEKYPEIIFTSVHPGAVETNFATSLFDGSPMLEFFCRTFGKLFFTMVTVEEGARGQIWCATEPKETIRNGAFYHPVGVLDKGSARSKDMKMAQNLWDWTEEQLELYR